MTSRRHLALVLHAHLPYARSLDPDVSDEERWFQEALFEVYLPLWSLFETWADRHAHARLSLSVSPTLWAMLDDEYMLHRAKAFGEACLRRWESAEHVETSARKTETQALRDGLDALSGPSFATRARALAQSGVVEFLTSTMSHGFLPNLTAVPQAAWAQVRLPVDDQRLRLGQIPQGLWLAECGYAPGVDALLSRAGLSYCVIDSTAAQLATPPPAQAGWPLRLPAGPVALPRDGALSEAVWSSKVGYPSRGAYADFHHRTGTLRLRAVDGSRWRPAAARAQAHVDAQDFLAKVSSCSIAPYDAELFGHWWREGPWFLGEVVQGAALSKDLVMVTARQAAGLADPLRTHEVPLSSWGEGGVAMTWVDPSNDFLLPRLTRLAERLSAAVREGMSKRVLAQAARELLLAQSSDWAFHLMRTPAASIGARRAADHADAVERLLSRPHDEAFLKTREALNNLFPQLDVEVYR